MFSLGHQNETLIKCLELNVPIAKNPTAQNYSKIVCRFTKNKKSNENHFLRLLFFFKRFYSCFDCALVTKL